MKHLYISGVSTLKLTAEKCTGCGRCVDVCPHGVFDIHDHRAQIIALDSCMECGACSQNCSFGALSVKKRRRMRGRNDQRPDDQGRP